jgi:hypothetical protein
MLVLGWLTVVLGVLAILWADGRLSHLRRQAVAQNSKQIFPK